MRIISIVFLFAAAAAAAPPATQPNTVSQESIDAAMLRLQRKRQATTAPSYEELLTENARLRQEVASLQAKLTAGKLGSATAPASAKTSPAEMAKSVGAQSTWVDRAKHDVLYNALPEKNREENRQKLPARLKEAAKMDRRIADYIQRTGLQGRPAAAMFDATPVVGMTEEALSIFAGKELASEGEASTSYIVWVTEPDDLSVYYHVSIDRKSGNISFVAPMAAPVATEVGR